MRCVNSIGFLTMWTDRGSRKLETPMKIVSAYNNGSRKCGQALDLPAY